ncbi:diacylglycerol/lipid kinase family protein [Teichococcus vastitatis]|uniref:Diacylglycerol kinase family lipid kinase n=1 Tax=Teichococcus vastitatis TaxID=2307076 RepID=A0ABS9WCG7_9PROT|nr:diacylglycerol kinase family protein [Pseudoroseomonas vastitatis]MCI0756996.1 diacylglycerol kinase family lipid kinase [Pseudoroseomonas vastitatis]
MTTLHSIAPLIVFNPAAGSRRRQKLRRALRLLPHAELAETAAPGDAERIAREAARSGRPCVVAAGGDGTIAEVAAGLAGSDTALGILPLGTANVLAQELGLPMLPEAAAACLTGGREALLWPGIARFADGRQRLFVQMVGAGFDAAVVHNLDLRLKKVLGRGAYVWHSLRELPRYRFAPIAASLDGAAAVPASALVISKGRFYAGRYILAPGASPAQPGFHVAMIQGGAARAMLAGALLPFGLLPRLPGLTLHRAAHVALTGPEVPVQADGDPAGTLPLTVEDAAGPLRVRLAREPLWAPG